MSIYHMLLLFSCSFQTFFTDFQSPTISSYSNSTLWSNILSLFNFFPSSFYFLLYFLILAVYSNLFPNDDFLHEHLCDDLERWNGRVRGRFKGEGIYVYIWLIHDVVQQKWMQCYKAITSQLKKKKRMFPKSLKRQYRNHRPVYGWTNWFPTPSPETSFYH